MKKDIHPNYHQEATATCACGNVMTVGSTRETLQTEACSKCHPFYTGVQKHLDAAGRIDRFSQRAALKDTAALAEKKAKKTTRTAVRKTVKTAKTPKKEA